VPRALSEKIGNVCASLRIARKSVRFLADVTSIRSCF
jgi:hypothetical protein